MFSPLKRFTADYRYLLSAAAHAAGFKDPVSIDLDALSDPLLKAARKGACLPIDGVLVRSWDPAPGVNQPRIHFGMRVYHIHGIQFVHISYYYDERQVYQLMSLTVVDRRDYLALYRIARRCRRDDEPPTQKPILPAGYDVTLWQNTIRYLEPRNLRIIKAYGGKARRGILLTGPPGNGKTMACRWIWEECRRRDWEWRHVTPDSYREARNSRCNAQEAVQELFRVDRRGIIFFDDMDLALRDRDKFAETEDQAVFLAAMDGLSVAEGVVYIFTTNCSVDLIDRAFKRPGRLDLVLHFRLPDAEMRHELMRRWHADIRAGINISRGVTTTDGFSFAELEEVKSLLILRFLESRQWDWDWACAQLSVNRTDLAGGNKRRVGFDMGLLTQEAVCNSVERNEDV
jgi:hypothetical protein